MPVEPPKTPETLRELAELPPRRPIRCTTRRVRSAPAAQEDETPSGPSSSCETSSLGGPSARK